MMSEDLWKKDYPQVLGFLQRDSEKQARRHRYAAMCLASIAFVMFIVILYGPPPSNPASNDAQWIVAVKISAGVVVPALFLFFSRVVWDYSNVWLGRAGTLEDLTLALKLLGVTPEAPRQLNREDSENLVRITESLARLRRSFEGDLLTVPTFEVPKPPG
jgi:hypothetical protein